METDIVLFWFLVITCSWALIVSATRFRSSARGWILIYLGILVIAAAGWLSERAGLIYAAFAFWLLLVLLPASLFRVYNRRYLQQNYSAARRIAGVICFLHPVDGWRDQRAILRALETAQRGDLAAATRMLRHFEGNQSVIGITAVANLYRMTNQWEQLLQWAQRSGLELHAQLLPLLLRAHAETGDLRGALELYARNKSRIAQLVPATSRDLCRLMLFAFYGELSMVDRLLTGNLSILPLATREFWIATAVAASGAGETAKRRLEELLPTVDLPTRAAIDWRLAWISKPRYPLDASALQILENAAREQEEDQRFGATPSLFSKNSRATQLLVALNVVVFVVEIAFGGESNPEVLYRLGALFPPAVRAGEWWRLATSLFLHFGPLHLGMNMVALMVLGPFLEFALGVGRYLLLYFAAGIGSMWMVMMLASGAAGEQLTVGASGCIMGLVGATGALMLRGWIRQNAGAARRRLLSVLLIIGFQTVFDSLVPQVSMTAHLAGAAIGAIVALTVRDRLSSGQAG